MLTHLPVNATLLSMPPSARIRNQKHTSADSHVSVDLYDCEGLGGGGSGAAGGLLHPFTPRGKVTSQVLKGTSRHQCAPGLYSSYLWSGPNSLTLPSCATTMQPLWRGDEGVVAAMELVNAAEKAAEPGRFRLHLPDDHHHIDLLAWLPVCSTGNQKKKGARVFTYDPGAFWPRAQEPIHLFGGAACLDPPKLQST